MQNEFFNPADCPFEVIGFEEELLDVATNKVLGSYRIEQPTRKVGSEGRMEWDLTATVTLKKGHRTVVVTASPEKPRRVRGMINILCGPVKGAK